MTSFRRGDVVLVSFVFADESDIKLRPGDPSWAPLGPGGLLNEKADDNAP
jgi:hypothetical protein